MATNDIEVEPLTRTNWSRRLLRRLLITLPVLLPFLMMVGTGLYGLDFGFHWDEDLLFGLVDWSIENDTLLPQGFYNYPSMSYWLTLAGVTPDFIAILTNEGLDKILAAETVGLREQLRAALETPTYHLRVRGIFLIVSSLAIIWVYLLQLAWRCHWLEALLAASILGLSWELAYHLRWIAPDGVFMQFGALTILFVMLSRLRPPRRVWLWCAAMAAGLACGTKYPAGLLLVPVLMATYQSWDGVSVRRGLLPRILAVLFIFGLSYLLTTPGTVLQPLDFARSVTFEIKHYRTGHVGHTVSAGFEHLGLNLSYFALTFFSRYEFVAASFFILSILGAYAICRESRQNALLFLSFPVLYILYMSTQRVMIARNIFVVGPFLAVLAARGTALLWAYARGRSLLRLSLAVFVTGLVLINGVWLVYAAETIRNRFPKRALREAAAYVEAHPQLRFFASDRVWAGFDSLNDQQHPNLTNRPSEADVVLFYTSEGLKPIEWPATRRNLTITWFGPWEVNFNYYPNWEGDDRILLMTMDQAREIGIPVVR